MCELRLGAATWKRTRWRNGDACRKYRPIGELLPTARGLAEAGGEPRHVHVRSTRAARDDLAWDGGRDGRHAMDLVIASR